MKIQEIIIIDEKSKEVIAKIPFNQNEEMLILKKGLELKVSYDKPFKTRNKKGLLVLTEKIEKTMTDLKEAIKEVD
jgi:hypothetical protein